MCYTFELWEEVLWRACNDEGNARAAHHVQENKRDDDDKHDENQRCKHIVGSLRLCQQTPVKITAIAKQRARTFMAS